MTNNRYFTDEDQQSFIHFQFPKLLIYAEKYKKMSGDAKILYVICADLMKLSMKNPAAWKSEKGYFVKLSNESIQDRLNCKNEKATKLLKELVEFGLIEYVRMGQGKGNRIHVFKLEYTESDIYRTHKEHDEMENDELSTGSKPYVEQTPEKPESRIRKNRNQDSGKTGDKTPEKPELLRTISINNNLTNNNSNNNLSLSNPEYELIDDILTDANFTHIEREKIIYAIDNEKLTISIEQIKQQAEHMYMKSEIRNRVVYFMNGMRDNEFRQDTKPRIQSNEHVRKVPFYDWLNERDDKKVDIPLEDLPY